MEKTKKQTNLSVDMKESTAMSLGYIPGVGWIAAIYFLATDSRDKVKWQAMQALGLGILGAAGMMFAPISLAVFGVQIYMLIKTYQGSEIRLPLVGDVVDSILKKK